MPELPDVETWKRYVDATALHQTIRAAEVDAPRMLKGISTDRLTSRLEGSRFNSTARHGKFLFTELSSGPWLILHFGMTGYLSYFKNADDGPGHARLLIRFSNGYNLAGIWRRRLGRISLADSPEAYVAQQGLGPDALDASLSLDTIRHKFSCRRGNIKSALLDQKFLAGIGNIYGDEMLFQPGIHPEAKVSKLDDQQVARFRRVMRRVLTTAIQHQADPDHLPASWLLPHRGKGNSCPRCGGRVKQLKVSGRTTYFCPNCQRAH